MTFADAEGFPVDGFCLGMGTHDRLLTAAGEMKLPLVSRFNEYFGDVEIAVEEIGALVLELRRLEASAHLTSEDRAAAARWRGVAEEAAAAGKPLLALAD
jgi:hypothetical protein